MTHSLHLESSLGDEITGAILLFTKGLVNFFKNLLGYFGVFLAMPLFVILVFIAWALTKWFNIKLRSELKELFTNLDEVEPHVLCDIHLDLKRFREKMEYRNSNVHIFQQIYIARPLYYQLNSSIQILKQAEDRLHKAAYPNLQIELTENQKKEISQLYSSALLEEWSDDEEYDVAMSK